MRTSLQKLIHRLPFLVAILFVVSGAVESQAVSNENTNAPTQPISCVPVDTCAAGQNGRIGWINSPEGIIYREAVGRSDDNAFDAYIALTESKSYRWQDIVLVDRDTGDYRTVSSPEPGDNEVLFAAWGEGPKLLFVDSFNGTGESGTSPERRGEREYAGEQRYAVRLYDLDSGELRTPWRSGARPEAIAATGGNTFTLVTAPQGEEDLFVVERFSHSGERLESAMFPEGRYTQIKIDARSGRLLWFTVHRESKREVEVLGEKVSLRETDGNDVGFAVLRGEGQLDVTILLSDAGFVDFDPHHARVLYQASGASGYRVLDLPSRSSVALYPRDLLPEPPMFSPSGRKILYYGQQNGIKVGGATPPEAAPQRGLFNLPIPLTWNMRLQEFHR